MSVVAHAVALEWPHVGDVQGAASVGGCGSPAKIVGMAHLRGCGYHVKALAGPSVGTASANASASSWRDPVAVWPSSLCNSPGTGCRLEVRPRSM